MALSQLTGPLQNQIDVLSDFRINLDIEARSIEAMIKAGKAPKAKVAELMAVVDILDAMAASDITVDDITSFVDDNLEGFGRLFKKVKIAAVNRFRGKVTELKQDIRQMRSNPAAAIKNIAKRKIMKRVDNVKRAVAAIKKGDIRGLVNIAVSKATLRTFRKPFARGGGPPGGLLIAPRFRKQGIGKRFFEKAGEQVREAATFGMVTLIMSLLGKKGSLYFLYTFIPDDSKILDLNPLVAKKRKAQKAVFNILVRVSGMNSEALFKLINTSYVNNFGKTAGDLIQEFSKGQVNLSGIDPATIQKFLKIFSEISKFLPALSGLFKKSDIPVETDFDVEVENPVDPKNGNGDKKDNTALIIGLSAAGLLVVGGGIFFATRK